MPVTRRINRRLLFVFYVLTQQLSSAGGVGCPRKGFVPKLFTFLMVLLPQFFTRVVREVRCQSQDGGHGADAAGEGGSFQRYPADDLKD